MKKRKIYIYIYIYYQCHKVSTKAAGRTRSNALAQIHHIVKIVSSDVVCKVHFEEHLKQLENILNNMKQFGFSSRLSNLEIT